MLLALPALVAGIGVVIVLTPTISRQTTPLGVSIPSGYIHHPVVDTAVRTYQLLCAGLTLLILLVLPMVPATMTDAAFALAPLCVVGGGGLVYIWQRRRIIDAKRAGNWYEGRPVGIHANITAPGAESPGHTPATSLWPAFVALACVASTIAYGVARYDALPDPYPAHMSATGVPTRWVPKTMPEALFAPGLSFVIVAMIIGMLWWLPRRPERGLPDGDAHAATLRRDIQSHTVRQMLVWIAAVQGVGTSVLTLLTWIGHWGAPLAITLAVMLVAVMIAILVPLVTMLPILTPLDSSATPGRDRESPDDDRYWKFGLIYVNRQDPSIMVPYRAGIGMTINMGHPAGMAFMAAVILLLVWSIVNGE